MDESLTRWLNSAAGQFTVLDSSVIAITRLGVPLMIVLVALQWWVREDRLHVRHTAIAAGLSFTAGLALNQALLLFVHRARPYASGVTHLILPPSADWSFPSDHATTAFAITTAFASHGLAKRTLLFLGLAILIACSRVFAGTHYVSDVFGGACTGIVTGIAVRFAYREGSSLDCRLTQIL